MAPVCEDPSFGPVTIPGFLYHTSTENDVTPSNIVSDDAFDDAYPSIYSKLTE